MDKITFEFPTMIAQQRSAMMTTQKMLAAVALGLLLGVPGLAKAQFNFTTIDVPGSTSTAANGNSTYEIVGAFDKADGSTHGFVLSEGVFTQIDVPGAVGFTSVNGINANGELAGIYDDSTRIHGYFLSKGVVTTLDPPDSFRSRAFFLNARGQVVGQSRDDYPNPNTSHGFVWSKGVFTMIDVPGASGTTVAIGINDFGDIVGFYVSASDGNFHGFLLSKGVYTTLDPPGSIFTIAQGINNAGEIVGYYDQAADGSEHGFVLSKGVYTTIDVPNSTVTQIFSINAQGEIVGAYVYVDDAVGVTHGFLGVPTR
jgi:uncharacterized membrane protein